jgi:hypothetical protein
MMKEKKYVLIAFTFILIFLFSDCKKEQDYYQIPPYFKNWSVFQTGSKWVYQYEESELTDTTIITSVRSEKEQNSRDAPYYETFTMYIKSGLFTILSTDAHYDNNNKESIFSAGILYHGNGSLGEIMVVSGMALDPAYQSINFHSVENDGFIDSLMVNNQEFYHAIHTSGGFLSDYKYDFYLVEHIGLVKMTVHHEGKDSTWNLLSYHVVQ